MQLLGAMIYPQNMRTELILNTTIFALKINLQVKTYILQLLESS